MQTAAPTGTDSKHRIVIVGGGFAGLNAARALAKAPVDVTLVDRRNFHLFQPLLYQVATGGLSPADLCAPLREVLKRQRNATVLLGEVNGFDVQGRRVRLDERELAYDTLIVAAGMTSFYFGNSGWEEVAPGLKDVEDATEIRSRILSAFEEAELTEDPARRQELLTFIIVGAGPTGVELAGAIGELARHTLKTEFRNISPEDARILLVEGADRILPPYVPRLSAAACTPLERLGVEILLETRVEEIAERSVTLRSGETKRRVPCATTLWAAGVQASPLAGLLAEACGAETDRAGRVKVAPDLSVPGHPEILILGDMAYLEDESGAPLPGVAPVAMQQGRYAADLVRRRVKGRPVRSFAYANRGSLAVIGRAAAVADLGWVKLSGYFAWLLWLFIHILYLVGFANRVLVAFQWAYSFLTRGRGARIIAHSSRVPLEGAPSRVPPSRVPPE